MNTVVHYVLAILCFLLAIRCLFNRVPDRSPDRASAGSGYVWELIFRSPPPSTPRDPEKLDPRFVRILGFLLFTVIGVTLIVT
ncbi:MAG TPA: hypothetical protein VIF64_14870 [Pyrinomonadaceae bacterium]|jgi:hypothetical protein